ncbi:MAG: hypothetical protein LBB60_01840 [Desulfovibrio sp.]|nr:hypothetical protein [Desulfovibrio sp.]
MAAALVLNLPPAGVLAACAGAVLPDVLDQRVARLAGTGRGQQRAFNRIHRGATHWFGWWVALFLGALVVPLTPAMQTTLTGLCFGGLQHFKVEFSLEIV